MDLIEDCKKRQAELMLILRSMDQDKNWVGNELGAERFKKSAATAISQYEKIIHLLKGEQVGHA